VCVCVCIQMSMVTCLLRPSLCMFGFQRFLWTVTNVLA
jgi:hypothetical protein